jgi:hypothetical protein
MWPRSRRNSAEKRPIVGHMFEQLALDQGRHQSPVDESFIEASV